MVYSAMKCFSLIFVYHIPTSTKSRRSCLRYAHRNNILLYEKPYQRELTRAAETLIQDFAKSNLLVRGNVRYLSADLLLFLTELLEPHIDANEKAAEIYKKCFRNVRDIPTPTVFRVKKLCSALLILQRTRKSSFTYQTTLIIYAASTFHT